MRAPNAPSRVLLFLSSPPLHAFRAHAISFRSGPGGELQRRWTGSSAASASPAPHSSPSPWRRQHDEESKGVKITVWWDLENCHVPSGVNVFQVPHRITSALRAHGIRGPVSITAFGDVSRMSHATQDALCTSGVRLNHVPICEKNSSDRSLLEDLVYWVARNPPPLHFFLISSSRALANILHRLRMNNYNILLASKDGASCALMSSATVMWQWSTLVSGESLTGMHVNHPPDGLHGSWYGHCRGSVDDLLPDPEQATVTQPEVSLEPRTDAKNRQFFEALVDEIRQILHLHPEGISITELFSELKRSNVALDKDYFVPKKFSHLLLSMPNILSIKFTPGDSQPLVFAVPLKAMNPKIDWNSNLRAGAGVNNIVGKKEDRNSKDDVKTSTLSSQSTEESSSHEGDIRVAFRSNEGDLSESEHSTLPDSSYGCAEPVHLDGIANMDNKEKAIAGSAMSHDGARGLKSTFLSHTLGWFRFWKTAVEDAIASEKVLGCVSKHVNQSVEERGSDRCGLTDTTTHSGIQAETNSVFSKPHFWHALKSFLCTSKVSDLISRSRTREELIPGLQKQGPLLLGSLEEAHLHQLVNLLIKEKKWLREFTSEGCPFERTFPVKGPTHGHDVNGLSSIFTDKTSHSSSKVLSRQGMRQQDWNSFSRTSDAKCPKDIAELRAWFSKFHNGSERISSMDYAKHFERKFGRKLDCVRYGYFTIDNLVAGCTSNSENHLNGNNYPGISRKDIISDCRNLLKDFLEHNPHGFNMGLFAPMFSKRYGYVLDYQKLGYPKLASMLQIIAGVRIQSSYALPAAVVHPDSMRRKGAPEDMHKPSLETRMMSGLDGENLTDGNHHDEWEELGSICINDKSRQEMQEKPEISEPSLETRMTSGLDGENLTDGNHHDEWEELGSICINDKSRQEMQEKPEISEPSLETRMMSGLDGENLTDEWEELGSICINDKSRQEMQEKAELSELFIPDEELPDPQQPEIISDRSQEQASGRKSGDR